MVGSHCTGDCGGDQTKRASPTVPLQPTLPLHTNIGAAVAAARVRALQGADGKSARESGVLGWVGGEAALERLDLGLARLLEQSKQRTTSALSRCRQPKKAMDCHSTCNTPSSAVPHGRKSMQCEAIHVHTLDQ